MQNSDKFVNEIGDLQSDGLFAPKPSMQLSRAHSLHFDESNKEDEVFDLEVSKPRIIIPFDIHEDYDGDSHTKEPKN